MPQQQDQLKSTDSHSQPKNQAAWQQALQHSIPRWPDFLFRNTARLAAFSVLSLLAAIILLLILGSVPSIKEFGFGFLFSTDWDPVNDKFGAGIPIYGTLVTAGIALLIGVPVSFGIALFLTELSPRWMRRPLGIAIELLAGIPSIIYGMWGLFFFAPFFADHIQPMLNKYLVGIPVLGTLLTGPILGGVGVLTAGIVLSIMVIPFIASVMRDVFETVPTLLKESAYGLGSTTWEVVWNVVLPYTKIGVVGAIMLGLGRALGETMAVTFMIGNAHELHKSLVMPGNSIASALANEFNEAYDPLHTSALVELGLILFFITFIVLAFARFLLHRLAKREGT